MIGIFDSGVGGLTVMKAIREELPSSDILYFGDIKNAPYGERSREELSVLTMQAIELLRARGADRMVSACNSLSASLAVSLFDAFEMTPDRLIEMVGPTVSYFRGTSVKVTLVATPATVQSGMYQNAFRMIGKDVEAIAMPGLAGAIEFGRNEKEIEDMIREEMQNHSVGDVLILACTHYPLVREVFQKVVGEKVEVFDPAEAVAERAKKLFWPQEVKSGHTQFIISKDSETFRKLVARNFTDSAYEIEVLK